MYNIYSTHYRPDQDKKFHSVKKRKKSLSFLTYFIIGIFIIIFIIIFLNKAWFFQIKSIEINTNLLSEVGISTIGSETSDSEIFNSVVKKYINIIFSSSSSIRKYLQTNFL